MQMGNRVSCSRWLLVPLAFVMACGGASQAELEAEPVEVATGAGGVQLPAEAYLPGETFGLAEIQVGELRSSPYYDSLRALMGNMATRGGAVGLAEVLAELLQRLDGVTIAFGMLDGRAELTGIIVRGSFTLDEAAGWMQRIDQGEGNDPVESVVIAGRPALAKRDGLFVQIEPTTWLLGPRAHLERRVEAPVMSAALTDPALVDATSRLSVAPWALRITSVAAAPVREGLVDEGLLDATQAAQLRAMSAAISINDGIDAEAFVLTSDASVASAIVERVRTQRDALSSQGPVRLLGLGNILDSAQIGQVGTDASLRVQVPDGTVRLVIGMLQGFLQMGGSE